MKTHLSIKSSNSKVGPIPVSTTSELSCPDSCPMSRRNDGGCYASTGPLAIHWRRITEGTRGMEFDEFCEAVKNFPPNQFWRHNQAGDLIGHNEEIDVGALSKLVKANKGKKGFTYTHKYNSPTNLTYIKAANDAGFTINVSANNVEQADKLVSLRIAPVVCVLPSSVDGAKTKTLQTVGGNKIVVCPASYKDNVTCESCQLCQKTNRSVIVGFAAHGTYKKKVNEMLEN